MLIKRFKARLAHTLAKMERDKCVFRDSTNGCTPRAYAQGVFRNAQAAGMASTLNQLSSAWNHRILGISTRYSRANGGN
jgi:hypothetical protein